MTRTASTEWIQDYKLPLEIYFYKRHICAEVSLEKKRTFVEKAICSKAHPLL